MPLPHRQWRSGDWRAWSESAQVLPPSWICRAPQNGTRVPRPTAASSAPSAKTRARSTSTRRGSACRAQRPAGSGLSQWAWSPLWRWLPGSRCASAAKAARRSRRQERALWCRCVPSSTSRRRRRGDGGSSSFGERRGVCRSSSTICKYSVSSSTRTRLPLTSPQSSPTSASATPAGLRWTLQACVHVALVVWLLAATRAFVPATLRLE